MSNEALEYTGERMVPEEADAPTFWEHVERYRFLRPYVGGRDLLDVACGEGYGVAAMLHAGARSVVGVDISEEACEHARRKYGVDARVGDATSIPLPDAAVDVVSSFETIEHVPEMERFVAECRRVLRPGGMLVISTPNRDIYRRESPDNPYHHDELSIPEFEALLAPYFEIHELFGQCMPLPPLFRLRGFGRLWFAVGRMLAPASWRQPTSAERADPRSCILAPATAADMFNNRTVRRCSRRRAEESRFVVAIAVPRPAVRPL